MGTLIGGVRNDYAAEVGRVEKASADATGALAKIVEGVSTVANGQKSSVDFLLSSANGNQANAQLVLNANGRMSGFRVNGVTQAFNVDATSFTLTNPNTNESYFSADSNGARLYNVEVDKLTYGSIASKFQTDSYLDPNGGWQQIPGGPLMQWGRFRQSIRSETTFYISFPKAFATQCFAFSATPYLNYFNNERDLWVQIVGQPSQYGASVATQAARSNDQVLDGFDWIAFGI